MEIKFELNTKALLKAYHLVPRQLETELRDALDHAGRKFLKTFYTERLTRTGADRIKSRGRGGIFSHFKRHPISGRGIDVEQKISTASPIAQIWEHGGDRVGRGRMAVPLKFRGGELFTATGRVKKRYRDVLSLVRQKKLFRREINGQMYLCDSKTGLPFFVLKNKIQVKPRLKFLDTFNTMSPEFSKIYNRAFDKALKKGGWK